MSDKNPVILKEIFDDYGFQSILINKQLDKSDVSALINELSDHLNNTLGFYTEEKEEKKAAFFVEASYYLMLMLIDHRKEGNDTFDFLTKRIESIIEGYDKGSIKNGKKIQQEKIVSVEKIFDQYGLFPILEKKNFIPQILESLIIELNDHLDQVFSIYLKDDEEKKINFSIESSRYLRAMLMESDQEGNDNKEFLAKRTREI